MPEFYPSPFSEAEVPIEPPSATTTTTIGISATSTTFTTAFSKKRASVATTPSTNRKNKKNKTKDSVPNEPIILQDPQVSTTLFNLPCFHLQLFLKIEEGEMTMCAFLNRLH